MDQEPTTDVYQFGDFCIDPRRRVLSRGAAPIALKPKHFEVLLYLVEHAGERLDKTALLAAVWPKLVVEENNLNKAISVLRRVLGEAPHEHKYIVTDPGHGYRFVATVVRRQGRMAVPTPSAARQWPLRDIAMTAAAAVALAGAWFLGGRFVEPELATPRAVRFQIETAKTLNPMNIALSPDGTQIAYVGDDERGSALWLRALDSLEPTIVQGADDVNDASYPFWSADGSQIAYRQTFTLGRVAADGGIANTVVDGLTLYRRGAWGKDGTILYAGDKTLYRIRASGGVPVAVTTLDAAAGEQTHSSPQFLPDGRHFLYKATHVDLGKGAIFVGSLDAQPPVRVLDASRAIYAAGYLVYARESALYAQRFDAARLELTGSPMQIADDVYYRDSLDTSAFDVVDTTLIYRAVPKHDRPAPLLWVERDGTTTAAATPSFAPVAFRLSPDGRKIVYDEGAPADIWTLDLERGARTRVTSSPRSERGALWSPDGRSIVYDAHGEGGRAIYEKRADGASPEELLLAVGAHDVAVTDWSADGRYIVFDQDACLGCDDDIWILPREPGAEPYPFTTTRFDEHSAVLSPDGRWLAYVTFESGTCQVVVQPFADPTAGKWQISAESGFAPRWSPDGRALYYFDGAGSIVRVAIDTETTFRAGEEVRVATAPAAFQWDVARDGERLLRSSGVADHAAGLPLNVILNWTALVDE